MWARFRGNFITGVAVILPAAVTLWLLKILYNAVNASIFNPLIKNLKPYLVNMYLEGAARTVIFLGLIFVVVLIGFATRIIFVKKLFSASEKLFFKIPMIGKIYVTIRQLSRPLFRGGKGIFMAPVLVEYPRKGVYSIAFLTSEAKGEIQEKTGKKLVTVFMPTSPNPTSGYLLFIPADEIMTLSMSIEDAMKLIISGGIITSEDM